MEPTIHRSSTRGFANHGWLRSHHTFSFADYYDPQRMAFGALRVLNDDWIEPSMGFGTHPHRDMEIITIPLQGALAHKDSTGTSAVIRSGEVQIMSAGTGILHSEFNASETEPVNLLQIWVMPKVLRVQPRYGQKAFSSEARKNQWQTVVSPNGEDGALAINQDAIFALSEPDGDFTLSYTKRFAANGIYLFVVSGGAIVDRLELGERDAVGLVGIATLEIRATKASKLLLIEVPMN